MYALRIPVDAVPTQPTGTGRQRLAAPRFALSLFQRCRINLEDRLMRQGRRPSGFGLFRRGALVDRGLRRGQPGYGHAERRARDVVEADPLAERDRGGVAAMLAADAELDPGARMAPAFRRPPDQFADPFTVDRDERVDLDDALADVVAEEGGRVVARQTEGRLGQIVGAEREE